MSEIAKPVELPRWGDVSGSIIVPPSAKQDSGWVGGNEKPPYQTFNWLSLRQYQWLAYLQNKTDMAFGSKATAPITVTSNSIDPTQTTHTLATAGGATDLNSIGLTNTADGRFLLLSLDNVSNPVTLRHNNAGSNQILMRRSLDRTLTNLNDFVLLMRVGTTWKEVFGSGEGLDATLSGGNVAIGTGNAATVTIGKTGAVTTFVGSVASVPTTTLDTPASGNTLNIGTTNANVINIGKSGSTVNIYGSTVNVTTTNSQITDNNIVLNQGGTDATSEGAGFTINRTGTYGSMIYKNALVSRFAIGDLNAESEVVIAAGAQTLTGKKTFTGAIAVTGGTTSDTLSTTGLATLSSLSVTGTSTFASGSVTGALTANQLQVNSSAIFLGSTVVGAASTSSAYGNAGTVSIFEVANTGTTVSSSSQLNLSTASTATATYIGFLSFVQTGATGSGTAKQAATLTCVSEAAAGANANGSLRFFTNAGSGIIERLRVKPSGALFVYNSMNNADNLGTSASPAVGAGDNWVPTASNMQSNTGFTGAYTGVWSRTGNVVTCSCRITVSATANGTIGGSLSLPVPSAAKTDGTNFNGGGACGMINSNFLGGGVYIDSATTARWAIGGAASGSGIQICMTFQYDVA